MTLFKHEWKRGRKSLLIWSNCIGVICFGCLLLFSGLEDTMGQMSEVYAQMGGFSAALGLDRLDIGTIEGFYGTELGLVFAIGGGMFAAMTGAVMLSKEEEGQTVEFLHALPFGRSRIFWWKYLAVAVLVLMFQIICILWELAGFALIGEMPEPQAYFLFHGAQLLMQWEMGSIGYLISSVSRKKQTGAALGLAMLLYLADVLCRVIPELEKLKYITPYCFSNAVDIFTEGKISGAMAGTGIGAAVAAVLCAAVIYCKKDL